MHKILEMIEKCQKYYYIVISMTLIVFCAFIIFFVGPKRFADESFHSLQIKRIYRSDHRFVPELTNIPGYHYTMAFMGRITDPIFSYGRHPKLDSIRLFHAILSLLLPIVLFFLIRELKQKSMIMFVVIFTPIIFPLLFLAYTDILSLTLFLCAFLFHIKKRYDLAGLFMLLDISVRQDNIIWIGFLLALLIYETYQNHKKIDKTFITTFFSQSLSYIIVTILFTIFYVFNGGVAIGDKSAHPSMRLHLGNVYLFFTTFSFLFLPIIIGNIKKIYHVFAQHKIYYTILILIGYVVFTQTFVVDHVYNHVRINFFIHNAVLQYITTYKICEALAYIGIVLAIGYFFSQSLIKKKYVIMLPFALVSLSLHWLIEPRYMIIPTVFALCTIRHQKTILRYQILYSIFFSVLLYFLIFIDTHKFL